jgi:hypothetical protein
MLASAQNYSSLGFSLAYMDTTNGLRDERDDEQDGQTLARISEVPTTQLGD